MFLDFNFLEFYPVINIKNEDFIKAFGKHLRKLRKQKKLTQEELAIDCNISISQVSRIERGEINTTLSTLLVLATALEIEPKDLFNFSF